MPKVAFPAIAYVLLSMIGVGCQFYPSTQPVLSRSEWTLFAAPETQAYYLQVLQEVGKEMGYKFREKRPDGWVWEGSPAGKQSGCFLKRGKAMYIYTLLAPQESLENELIPEKMFLKVTLSPHPASPVDQKELRKQLDAIKAAFMDKL